MTPTERLDSFSGVIVRAHSSAPHIRPAAAWQAVAAKENAFVLYRGPDGTVEVGIRSWPEGNDGVVCECDLLCYFQRGRGIFRRNTGESIEVVPGTAVHFKQDWRGTLESAEPLEASYIKCEGGPATHTPILREVPTAGPLKDWGPIPTMIEGISRTAGMLLSREASGRAESGIWTCTPGVWRCEVSSDEYCHFVEGSCTYTHESGESIAIEPDTLAFFPEGWKGTCSVRRSMRKVYMIR